MEGNVTKLSDWSNIAVSPPHPAAVISGRTGARVGTNVESSCVLDFLVIYSNLLSRCSELGHLHFYSLFCKLQALIGVNVGICFAEIYSDGFYVENVGWLKIICQRHPASPASEKVTSLK